MKSLRVRKLAGLTTLLLGAFVMSVGALPAAATHVEPTFVSGNQNCEAATGLVELLRIEGNPVQGGTFPVTGGSITVTINGPAQTFDWTSTGVLIGAVFVKGGPDGNLYDYTPAGATSDTGLHAPVGPSGGYYGLSHITFCVTETPTTTTTQPTTTTTEATTTTSEATTTTQPTTTTTTTQPTTTTTEATTTTSEATTTTQPTTTTTTTQPTTTTTEATTTTTQPTTTTTTQATTTSEAPTTTLAAEVLGLQVTAQTLPFTGVSTAALGGVGLFLISLGTALVAGARRGERKATVAMTGWSSRI